MLQGLFAALSAIRCLLYKAVSLWYVLAESLGSAYKIKATILLLKEHDHVKLVCYYCNSQTTYKFDL